MKYTTYVIALSFALSGCAFFKQPKRAPEVVASCFSDGEDQTKMCKAQRTNEENRIVITRCIGTQNREASPVLRGKCVEKICSEGSNTDCLVKGEIRVLAQYSELVTSNMFDEGSSEAAPAPASVSAPAPAANKKHVIAVKEKKLKGKMTKVAGSAVGASVSEVDTDPSVALPPMPEQKPEVVAAKATPVPKKIAEEEVEEELQQQMSIALKPAKPVKKKSLKNNKRAHASVKADERFKKVCVGKNDSDAPEILRGKCATRSCSAKGKCTYKGHKEMFDYVAKSDE